LQSLFKQTRFRYSDSFGSTHRHSPILQHEQLYREVNEQGFKNVVEFAEKAGIKKIIYASSSSVYGNCTDYPFTETSDTTQPLNPYASTKKNNELFAETYVKQHKITLIGLRFFTVYGPWTRPDMATYNFIRNILNNKEIALFQHDNKSMVRDFTFIDDICEAIALLVKQQCTAKKNTFGHNIYNIGGGEPIDVAAYVEEIGKQTGYTINTKKENGGEGEMIKTYADCKKLFHYISFKPKVNIKEGLKKTIEWYNLAGKYYEG
jgi:UDP-glucuronate 4-epimerase